MIRISFSSPWIDFMMNRVERNLGMDLNGDGYIGGEGRQIENSLSSSLMKSSLLL